MTFEELEALTIEWADTKGILEKSNAHKQFEKTLEEIEELAIELSLLESVDPQADMNKMKSELGDVLVTLILVSYFMGTPLTEALEVAYTKISKRKGKMVDGLFVKE